MPDDQDFSTCFQTLNEEEMERSTILDVQGMTCQSCVKKIDTNVGKEAGVISIKVNMYDDVCLLTTL